MHPHTQILNGTHPELRVLRGVESSVCEERGLVVLRAVGREDRLTHERVLLRIPDVAVVNARHEDVREEDADVLVDLEPDGVVEPHATDQVPIEAQREKAHALIVTRAAENVPDDGAVVVRQAEDGDTRQNREDPCMSHELPSAASSQIDKIGRENMMSAAASSDGR